MAEPARKCADRLDGLFRGQLEPFRHALTFGDPDDDFLPASELLRTAALDRALDAFGESLPDVGRRVVASLWSQWYFGLVVPTVVVHAIGAGRKLMLAPDRVGLRLHAQRRYPVAIRVPDTGVEAARAGAGPLDLLGPLIFEHLQPIVGELGARTGLPSRVLWGNAAVYLDWALRRLEEDAGTPYPASVFWRLFSQPEWPDGRRNPFCGSLVRVGGGREEDDDGREDAGAARRTACCMRFRVAGVDDCGRVCPVNRRR